MPSGIYERTDSQKLAIARALQGNKNSLGYKHPADFGRKMSLIRRGKIPYSMTEGIKQKISNSLKGHAPWNKGELGYLQGRKVTAETKEKMRQANSGANAPNWKGGISTRNELLRRSHRWQDWRKTVFERDKYTCQQCGAKSETGDRICLHPHHIKTVSQFPELVYEIDNGITLCKACHILKHSIGKQAVKLDGLRAEVS